MKYLLIDNCSLRHLIDNNSYSKYIQELEQLISTNRVELITHELIILEWNKYKEKWKNDKERKIKYLSNSTNSNDDLQNNGLIKLNSPISNIHLTEQINKIDTLLLNCKLILKTPEGIKNETHQRLKDGNAPFHKKKDSLSDWEIFGTASQYCENYGINQLFFISHNYTDFGDENNIERRVHSTLCERFKKINIIYYRYLNEFFEEVDNDNYFPIHLLQFQIIQSAKFSFASSLGSNVLDSLYYLFKEKYNEINYIPIHILQKYYPFSKSNESNTYYEVFRLSNVNEELIEFFDNIIIEVNNEISFKDENLYHFVNDYQVKTKFVLESLNKNLIFHLNGEKSRKTICTHYTATKKCDCYKCCFNRFELVKSIDLLKGDIQSNQEKLSVAYIHFQLGNYITSNILYDEIILNATVKKEYLLYFIAKYNKHKLADFLRNPFVNKNVDYNLIEELKNIDPLEEAVKLKSYTDYNFLSFIAQEDFFNSAFQVIRLEVNKILDHYHSQLRGGWSSNQFIWNLIEEFVKIDTLLNSNFIIYDNYSNFYKLFEGVTEGLFASHAMSETQTDKFKQFDDYWVHKFIIYGDKKSMIKYFNRFYLKTLKYKKSGVNNDSLIDLSTNLLTKSNIINGDTFGQIDKNNDFYNSLFNRLFENLLTVSALLDIDSVTTNSIANNLLSFLKNEDFVGRSEKESVIFFIENKKDFLTEKNMLSFLTFFIYKNERHNESNLIKILQCCNKGILAKISEKNFERLYKFSTKFCEKCNRKHSIDILYELYDKVELSKKRKIRSYIQNELTDKFEFELFYSSSIFGIIKADFEKLFILIDDFKIDKSEKKLSSFFGGREDFLNSKLDRIINLCFKLNIDTTDKRFKKFHSIHPYYKWVLDMNNFNYKKFNPEWAMLNNTIYYNKAMSNSQKLTNFLINFLKSGFHLGIERILIRISFYSKEK
jgi:hypothetical protein